MTVIARSTIDKLEQYWRIPDGVLFRLRQGFFDEQGVEGVLRDLREIRINEDEQALPRNFVSLLWYIPIVMEWQNERVRETGGDLHRFGQLQSLITNEVERILGVP